MKILVVDNSKSTLFFLNSMLSRYGHQVRIAEGGVEALEMLKSFSPDVMFIDWVMPNISGDKLCRMVRELPGGEKIHIIIMSAMLENQSFEYKDFGANACLAKGPKDEMESNITMMLAFAGRETDLGLSSGVVGLEGLYPRQATSELLAMKMHLEAILNALTDGVLELNATNRIVVANPAALALFQRAEQDLLSVDFLKLFALPVAQMIEAAIVRAQEEHQSVVLNEPVSIGDREVVVTLVAVQEQAQPCTVVILREICTVDFKKDSPPID